MSEPFVESTSASLDEPTHLDLFSGIGGFALAARWAGFRTVAFCEIEDHCQKVLQKQFVAENVDGGRCSAWIQPDTSPEGGGALAAESNPRLHSDIRLLDGTRYRGVYLLTAGVPCQPASCAGQRRGEADDRWLWPEALRILGEAKPAWAVFENPPGLLTLESGMVFERILAGMESHGYEVCPPLIIPARGVQADYYRCRVFVVAHLDEVRKPQCKRSEQEQRRRDCNSPESNDAESECIGTGRRRAGDRATQGQRPSRQAERLSQDSAIVGGAGLPASEYQELPGAQRQHQGRTTPERCWPETHFGLLRGIPGVSHRVDRSRRARIHALGNSVVPAQVYPILREIRKLMQ